MSFFSLIRAGVHDTGSELPLFIFFNFVLFCRKIIFLCQNLYESFSSQSPKSYKNIFTLKFLHQNKANYGTITLHFAALNLSNQNTRPLHQPINTMLQFSCGFFCVFLLSLALSSCPAFDSQCWGWWQGHSI